MAVSRINEAGLNINQYGNRNIVINGAMQVAQRGTSSTGLGASAGYFTCDRWKMDFNATAGRLTMSQTADGPEGFANCIKLDCTTADTSIAAGEYILLEQRFEGQDLQQIGKGTASAKELKLSFYVKANAAFTFGVELFDNDNTRQITKLFTTTTGWNRIELTYPADTTGAFDDDNARSLLVTFWLHSGSTYAGGTLNSSSWAGVTNANRAAGIDSFFSSTSNEFYLTGVQLEVGDTATDFEHRTFADELQRCQRYFRDDDFVNYVMTAYIANDSYTQFMFFPRMRAAPTGTVSNAAIYANGAARTGSGTCVTLNAATYGITLRFNGTTGVSVEAAALLVCDATFDAEL